RLVGNCAGAIADAAVRRKSRSTRGVLCGIERSRPGCAGGARRQGAELQQPAGPRGRAARSRRIFRTDVLRDHQAHHAMLAGGASPLEAYQKALACDPQSAFGSVIAFTAPVDTDAAEALSSLFVECIVAPSFSADALAILGKKKNLRVLEGTAAWPRGSFDFKRVRGGLLVQDRAPEPVPYAHWRVVTDRTPTDRERDDLAFAWQAVASVKSNAIVLVRDGATIGIGAGQMSRVDASFLSVHKAHNAGHETAGAALGSDAYFPFRDGVDHAAEAGVTAIVQPGGSIRDAEVIAAANEHGIAMVFTGQRQFRH